MSSVASSAHRMLSFQQLAAVEHCAGLWASKRAVACGGRRPGAAAACHAPLCCRIQQDRVLLPHFIASMRAAAGSRGIAAAPAARSASCQAISCSCPPVLSGERPRPAWVLGARPQGGGSATCLPGCMPMLPGRVFVLPGSSCRQIVAAACLQELQHGGAQQRRIPGPGQRRGSAHGQPGQAVSGTPPGGMSIAKSASALVMWRVNLPGRSSSGALRLRGP